MSENSLKITSGKIRLLINDDHARVIQFNPNDIAFAERFYKLMKDFKTKLEEYKGKLEQLDKVTAKDKLNIPINIDERIAAINDVCKTIKDGIDNLFGVNAAMIIFEGENNLEAIEQFFEGIVPFIEKARKEKMSKYSEKNYAGVKGKKKK